MLKFWASAWPPYIEKSKNTNSELGKAVYTFENYDRKNNLLYGDDSYKIIINTSCPAEDTPAALRTFFDYVNKMKIPGNDDFIAKVHGRVRKYNTPEWRRQIMTLEEKMKEEARRGYEEGKTAGLIVLIETCQEIGLSHEETSAKVECKFSMSKEETDKYMDKYWK